jgi:hypothetical protein
LRARDCDTDPGPLPDDVGRETPTKRIDRLDYVHESLRRAGDVRGGRDANWAAEAGDWIGRGNPVIGPEATGYTVPPSPKPRITHEPETRPHAAAEGRVSSPQG